LGHSAADGATYELLVQLAPKLRRKHMQWNARPDLMAEIVASIRPVQTEEALRQVLAHDFPKDCAELPISGGWGYSRSEAIVFVRDAFPTSMPINFVPLEYHISQKIIYEELIIFRPKDYRFSGIEKKLLGQDLTEQEGNTYDRLNFVVSCWSDWHWDQLRKEWEDNEFGQRVGFDLGAHQAKRGSSQVKYEREFWFDITDVFRQESRARAIPM
jgi:hypothetical protein